MMELNCEYFVWINSLEKYKRAVLEVEIDKKKDLLVLRCELQINVSNLLTTIFLLLLGQIEISNLEIHRVSLTC